MIPNTNLSSPARRGQAARLCGGEARSRRTVSQAHADSCDTLQRWPSLDLPRLDGDPTATLF
jgi:hypothetical protein